MKASRALGPLACAAGGFLVGAYVYPGSYAYGSNARGVSYRVHRLTGVQEFASSRGWVSERELVKESFDGLLEGMRDAFRPDGTNVPNPHP